MQLPCEPKESRGSFALMEAVSREVNVTGNNAGSSTCLVAASHEHVVSGSCAFELSPEISTSSNRQILHSKYTRSRLQESQLCVS